MVRARAPAYAIKRPGGRGAARDVGAQRVLLPRRGRLPGAWPGRGACGAGARAGLAPVLLAWRSVPVSVHSRDRGPLPGGAF